MGIGDGPIGASTAEFRSQSRSTSFASPMTPLKDDNYKPNPLLNRLLKLITQNISLSLSFSSFFNGIRLVACQRKHWLG